MGLRFGYKQIKRTRYLCSGEEDYVLIHRNGEAHIVMRGVQKCTGEGASLRDRNVLPLCCINLDTATDPTCGLGTDV